VLAVTFWESEQAMGRSEGQRTNRTVRNYYFFWESRLPFCPDASIHLIADKVDSRNSVLMPCGLLILLALLLSSSLTADWAYSFCRLRDVPWADYDLQGSRYHRENNRLVPYDLSVDGELQASRADLDSNLLRPGEEDPFFV
jgi:hypothetical protein